MTGINDMEAERATRWAKAEKFAQGYADHGMGQALTIYYTRFFPLIALAAIGIAAAVAAITAQDRPVDWWFAAWLGSQLLAVSSAIGGITYNVKRLKPRVTLGSTLSIVMPLEKEEQQALTRGINGKESVPDEHLTIARSQAIQSRKTAATWLLVAPAFTYVFGSAFASSSTFFSVGWYYLVMLALMIVILVILIRSFRRQGQFLIATERPPESITPV